MIVRRGKSASPAEKKAPSPLPDRLPFEILFQTPRLVIINKPAGLVSHAGPRGGPSVEDYFPLLSRHRNGPWLAHRLDTDTAGCLAIALRKQELIGLQRAFADRQVRKIYWALVDGVPEESGTIDAPLLRHSDRSGWKMVVSPEGQAARTSWRRLGTDGAVSWLELELHTGRTHQARVHCAALGAPVAGDPVYGARGAEGKLCLLSRELVLPGEPLVRAKAPPPPHMVAGLKRCGWDDA